MQFVPFGDFQREDHLASCVSVSVPFLEHPMYLEMVRVDVIRKMLSLALSDPLLVAIFN